MVEVAAIAVGELATTAFIQSTPHLMAVFKLTNYPLQRQSSCLKQHEHVI
jgi:hypothetical protein